MKNITINGYQIATFKVGNSHHITVHPNKNRNGICEKEFNENSEANVHLSNQFSETFKRFPNEWTERVVKNPHNNRKQILIIILK